MNGFEKFIHALHFEVANEPKVFGWYHLACIAVFATLVALVFVFRKKITKRFINISLLTTGCALLVTEVFKELIHSLDVIDGVAVWEYSWRNFPFQFCSIPIYLMVIAGILRKGKVYDVLLTFLATFALWAGIAVMIYPSTVLSSVVFYSVHTMLWHGCMVVIGFMLLATGTVQLKYKNVAKACIVFGVVVAIAQIMNIIWHYCGTEKTFNMLYISPYYISDIPVLDIVQENAPYAVFFLSYLIGFAGIAFLVMAIAKGINKLHNIVIAKKQSKATVNAEQPEQTNAGGGTLN